ncbi:hypothetical protein ACFPPD_18465 [Cohnella suwonensis]|uniref:Uncharacterized protein n=1 Tax=Cohnella suwonensis TaxID=696072 RepID=A0ABW0LXW6_9BACL
MASAIKWTILLLGGIVVGIWYGAKGTEAFTPLSAIVLFASILVFSILVVYAHAIYVLRFSNNPKEVEAYLKKAVRNPFYEAGVDLMNGNIAHAATVARNIKNEQQRIIIMTDIQIEWKNAEAAAQLASRIKHRDTRYVFFAHIALLRSDWKAFETAKSRLKKPAVLFALDANAAFRKGQIEEAKRCGDLAIANAKGLLRYSFMKTLERQQNNPNRESYF